MSGTIHHTKEDNIHISALKVLVGGELATLKRKSEEKIQYSIFIAVDKTHRLAIEPKSENELIMFEGFRGQKDPEAD